MAATIDDLLPCKSFLPTAGTVHINFCYKVRSDVWQEGACQAAPKGPCSCGSLLEALTEYTDAANAATALRHLQNRWGGLNLAQI
jgi:hypothetical protein